MTTRFRQNSSRAGFTLMELMVVLAIIALLAGLTLGAFSFATKSASRNRTAAAAAAIKSGLENYKAEFGEYPEPADATSTIDIQKKTYRVGGAKMLYQAMSGDGTNAIKLSSGGTPSNGEIEDSEVESVMLKDMPAPMWMERDGEWFMIDGFRKPFQYTKGGGEDSVNSTYDLWSYSDDEENTESVAKADKLDAKKSAKWLTNWR